MPTFVPLAAPPASPVEAAVSPQAGHAVDEVAVRAWARSRGYPIDESGSIPVTVLRTYRRLHPA